MTPDRRDFLWAAALAAAAGATGAAAGAPVEAQDARRPAPRPKLDQRSLDALADAVLPESIGAGRRRDAARAFGRWLQAYPAGVEEMHGYGYAEITVTPEDPGPRWAAQFEVLDRLAFQADFSRYRRFRDLSVQERREILAVVLARVPGPRLPANPHDAPHVALALMAHWAATADAVDLAYGVRIGRQECGRPLAENPREPLPLAPGQR